MTQTSDTIYSPATPTKVLSPAQLLLKASLLALAMVLVMLVITGVIYFLYRFITTA